MTFSGVCVLQPKLQKFEDAWSGLLLDYKLESLHMARASRLSEKHGPEMPRGQTADQRMDALLPFADCINKYLDVGLIQAWDVKGFSALSKDARYKLGSPDDPYYLAFARGLIALRDHVQPDDYIQLFCDDDRETAWDCYRHYRGIGHADPAIFKKVVSLTFADDQHFPALQAADMVAFLSRLEAKSRFYGDHYDFRRLFNYLTTSKKHMQWLEMFADEATIRSLSESLKKS